MPSIADERRNSFGLPEGLQSVRAVAEFLAVSRSKVYLMMESGDLPYVKLGKSRRVQIADLKKLIEANTFGRS